MRVFQRSKEDKKRHGQSKHSKQSKAQKTQLDVYTQGIFYKLGVAIGLVKKTLKTVAQNPKRTHANQIRCPYYHPLYYTALAHKACSSPLCHMKPKSKVKQAVALKFIPVSR